MKTFQTWLEMTAPPHHEDPYETWVGWYDLVEPIIRDSCLAELEKTGTLTIRGMEKRAGVSEGYANFLVREFLRRHKRAEHDQLAASLRDREPVSDGYLYHVTTARRLPLIKKNGLSPGAPSQFSNYSDYSRGKVFFCEKSGLGFWKMRVQEHEDANHDRASKVVVLRVQRSLLEDKLQNDGPGTEDSRSPSYFVTERVPAKVLKVVGI